MKTKNLFRVFSLGLAIIALPFFVFGQKSDPAAASAAQRQLLKRVITKGDKVTFGAGGTISVVGPPQGSVTIIGWDKNQIEVSAEIEVQAENEADLALMTQVNGIAFDPSTVSTSILTVGMHDKAYMKKNWKKFPKRLLSMPWKIDYVIHVPAYSDIDLTLGKGPLKISGIDGSMMVKAAESDADLELIGGMINATFGAGNVNVRINSRSWRGRNMNVNVTTGNLNVILPGDFNADIDASVIRSGDVQNTHSGVKEREERNKFTPKNINGRAGNGGPLLSFVMGDGTVKISEKGTDQ